MSSKPFFLRLSLVQRIIIGLVIGAVLGLVCPGASWIALLGKLFVGALKAIAPTLVFFLVISSLARSSIGFDRRFGFVIFEYILSTFLAALTAVALCFAFPVKIRLAEETVKQAAPGGVWEVLGNQLIGMVSNPLQAFADANYISVLFWAIIIGVLSREFAS
ncbi:MAG: cation:dicarboxylase symporter family transporter, partial [Victivallales bacterium]|nr:cation:dicarboxylase symporter family transporter [Victivallales bacterium]